ncbi:MAG: GNAT family N-acetyltransferase [Phycisphaeraceae bacterium]|nr:GNAT family N-acetyltransferase [Phycisphaeraceae bacterium]
MIEHVIIRLGEMADLSTLVEYNVAMAKETEGIDLKPKIVTHGVKTVLLGDSHGFYMVAEHEEQILGSLLVTFEWSDWRCARFWWIQSVYVKPEMRKQGVYRRLYAHTRALAKQQPGVCGLRLYAMNTNDQAQKTYAQVGMHKSRYEVFEELIHAPE